MRHSETSSREDVDPGSGYRVGPEVPAPAQVTVDPLESLLAVAHAHPDRPAVISQGEVMSYTDLADRIAAVAAGLGDRPGIVGVAARHDVATVTALFGVWAAGGTWCPVDPAYPPARQQAMLAAAGCRTLLDPEVLGAPPPGRAIEAPERPFQVAGVRPATPGHRSNAAGGPAGAAYVLFTSGSTGEPKPVAVSRRALGASTASLRRLFGLTPADRVLQFASLNWDTCFEEIVPALTAGACLVLDRDAHSGSFPRFLRLIERERVSVLDLPTAYWHELVNHLRESAAAMPACVRLVVIGGEPVSPARLADWHALATGRARLVNTYGCTETVMVTHAVDLAGPYASAPTWPASLPPIGRALPHVVEHLTGEGELLIGGPALATGYPGRPQETAARFIRAAGRRWFRTGDRVARTSQGLLTFRGRVDDEIKVRGIRVNPAEVEAHIAAHPAVAAVAVAGVGVGDHTALVAHVVARASAAGADPAALAASVTAHLRERVPGPLVPGRIRVVADLARTPTGKVDRRRITEESR